MESIVDVYKTATEQLQVVVSQTPQRIKKLNELIQRADWEEQDILHLAELENFNASQGYSIAEQIKKVRNKRRKYKDELEALSALHRVANNNSKLESHVSQLAKSIKEDNERKEKRKYNVKVRTDLTSRFERIHVREGKLK
ncbi:hypothetical protein ABE073_05070 [Lederbergia citrisecunda]|uniref:hypothetical protein n=1 Tax=Lederbergia citrisecunda TaxID=2833583 RepID=UPI003D2E0A91